MMNIPWDLDTKHINIARIQEMSISELLLVPNWRLGLASSDAYDLSNDELLHIIWAISDLSLNRIPFALFDFEQKLLSHAENFSEELHACILWWSSICRIYCCDPANALLHINTARSRGFIELVPEIQLIEAIAMRVSGKIEAAIEVFNKLIAISDIHPSSKDCALAWRFEANLFAGQGYGDSDLACKLEQLDRCYFHGAIGAMLAPIYRLLIQRPGSCGEFSADDILERLDRCPPFERPLLTMVLFDILPRPLAGVERGKGPIEAYWS